MGPATGLLLVGDGKGIIAYEERPWRTHVGRVHDAGALQHGGERFDELGFGGRFHAFADNLVNGVAGRLAQERRLDVLQ